MPFGSFLLDSVIILSSFIFIISGNFRNAFFHKKPSLCNSSLTVSDRSDIIIKPNKFRGEEILNIIYREADVRDAAALIAYQSIVGGETDNLSFGKDSFRIPIDREERFIMRFKKNPKDLMLVALDGDKVVANASIERNRIERYSHRAELSVTVLRDYWGNGIGSALMERLITFCKNTGVRVVNLEVRSDNERAKALYRKFGFELVGTSCDFFMIDGRYFDADLMNLYI